MNVISPRGNCVVVSDLLMLSSLPPQKWKYSEQKQQFRTKRKPAYYRRWWGDEVVFKEFL